MQVNRKIMTAVGLTLLSIIGGAVLSLRSWPLINVVETGRTPEYPDVVPRGYRATVDRVFDAALHAVHRLPRWTMIDYAKDRGAIRAEARTRVLRFVDDVVIHVVEQGQMTTVHMRSASRVGRGDFGQNARNIRTFFEELDRQMGERAAH